MAWQLTQLSDQGTSNPIVARLTIGLFEILDMAQISKEKKQAITEHCFELSKNLVLAEKAALPLMQELRDIEQRLEVEGVRTQADGRVVETPGVMHLDGNRVFLKYAKDALQTLANVMGIILQSDFQGPHFHRVRDCAIEKLGKDHAVLGCS